MDCRKAFPSAFQSWHVLVKIHKQGVQGRFWRMLCCMYSKIETRVLTGHEDDSTPDEELEGLYLQVNPSLHTPAGYGCTKPTKKVTR
jgi:hypothetical protein